MGEELHATFGELAGRLVLPDGRAAADALDPLPSFELPTDRPVTTTRVVAAMAEAAEASVFHVAGAPLGATGLVVRALGKSGNRRVVALTPDLDSARALASDASFYLASRDASDVEARGASTFGKVLLFSPNEASPYADVSPDRRAAETRLATLFHLAMDLPWSVLVCPITALARKVLPKSEVLEHAELVMVEQEIDRDKLTSRLGATGYVRSPLVEDPGTFAVRGALLDVWAPCADAPVRVEFYGDLVMSAKPFDPENQRTSDVVLKEVWLPPVREAILTPANVERARQRVRALCDTVDFPSTKARALVDDIASGRSFFGSEGFLPAYVELHSLSSYLPEDAIVVLEDPPSLTRALRDELGRALVDEGSRTASPRFPSTSFYETEAEVAAWLGDRTVIALHATAVEGDAGDAASLERFEVAPPDAPSLGARSQADLERAIKAARASRGKHGALDPLVRRIGAWQEAGLRVVLAARAETQVERLVALLRHKDVPVRARLGAFDPAVLDESSAEARSVALVVSGALARGVVAPTEGLVLVTEEEIFGARVHRRRARADKSATGTARAFLEDLRTLVVGDYVVHVEHGVGKYNGLVHKEVGGLTVDLIAVEYAGGDKLYLPVYRLNQIQKFQGGEGAPKIDRLGGQTFAKTKAKVQKNVRKMADELLRLYAERRAAHGEAFPAADDDYRAFEATFPFDETADQARAIQEVGSDLEAPRPMDRLVCGDVGFGKTEVAIRAAFRAASAGKQVAVLCPTTVLAQQHFLNFEQRMSAYPLKVGVLSRFATKQEQDEVVRGLRDGSVDIVVGTHRLLSKDVHFKRLGLLVVDEEQRFGVTHKERIKALKTDVDVLTLSATPIPRTLQMAVTGLRDMSIISTPPADRRSIRTIVTRHDENVIRDAVTRELGRGGQVFYVYNRVEGLYERAARLAELVPNARICVGHGQMGEGALEQSMLDFVEGRYDILCATAIIESGLDIPRANTILIDRADMFGLSQLYQLRGRVGRAKERAYCYLIVPPVNAMTDESRMRIEALERHSELGSGFQIASLDLEIRGSGDLLGAEQSGNVASVGFELFCQMLDEAVHELRGEPIVHEVDPELVFDADALLPEEYVGDIGVRLSLYKRLASAVSAEDVDELAVEMEDRFGAPPPEARRFVHLMRLKTELRRLHVLACEATSSGVTLHLRDDTPLDGAKILALVQPKRSPYRLSPDMKLTRRLKDGESFASGLEATDKLVAELAGCMKDA